MNSLNLLEQADREDELTHAYLAPVRQGTDIPRYAAELGRVILCPPDYDECGRKVLRNTHPDFFWITAKNDKRKISINQVEEIISSSSYSPQEEDRKVYAIGKAEDLSREAANSLLKILEDPPGFVYFILLTENPNNLLPTILSRCQQLPTGGTDSQGIKKALLDEGFEDEEARYLAEVVNNRADLLDQLLEIDITDPLNSRDEAFTRYEDKGVVELGENLVDTENLIEKEVLSRLIIRKLETGGKCEILTLAGELKQLPREELSWFLERILFIYREECRKRIDDGRDSGKGSSLGLCLEKARAVATALESLKTNANVQLLLESLCLQLANGDTRFKQSQRTRQL
ncbi:hypothetical protein KGY71_03575 [Candidatus Bipolaricaulota bacterium]|nr:hypothetical protein [Candidatus Bipolaricaulota bacterium]